MRDANRCRPRGRVKWRGLAARPSLMRAKEFTSWFRQRHLAEELRWTHVRNYCTRARRFQDAGADDQCGDRRYRQSRATKSPGQTVPNGGRDGSGAESRRVLASETERFAGQGPLPTVRAVPQFVASEGARLTPRPETEQLEPEVGRLAQGQPLDRSCRNIGNCARWRRPLVESCSITCARERILEWVEVSPGSFQMGCAPGGLNCVEDEQPVHGKTVRGFRMMATEVTVAMYKAYTASTGQRLPDQGDDVPSRIRL